MDREAARSSGSVYRSTSTPAHTITNASSVPIGTSSPSMGRGEERGSRPREQTLWQAPLVARVQRGSPISFSKLGQVLGASRVLDHSSQLAREYQLRRTAPRPPSDPRDLDPGAAVRAAVPELMGLPGVVDDDLPGAATEPRRLDLEAADVVRHAHAIASVWPARVSRSGRRRSAPRQERATASGSPSRGPRSSGLPTGHFLTRAEHMNISKCVVVDNVSTRTRTSPSASARTPASAPRSRASSPASALPRGASAADPLERASCRIGTPPSAIGLNFIRGIQSLDVGVTPV